MTLAQCLAEATLSTNLSSFPYSFSSSTPLHFALLFFLYKIITLISYQTQKLGFMLQIFNLQSTWLECKSTSLFHKAGHAILDFLENIRSKSLSYRRKQPQRIDVAKVTEHMWGGGMTAPVPSF